MTCDWNFGWPYVYHGCLVCNGTSWAEGAVGQGLRVGSNPEGMELIERGLVYLGQVCVGGWWAVMHGL